MFADGLFFGEKNGRKYGLKLSIVQLDANVWGKRVNAKRQKIALTYMGVLPFLFIAFLSIIEKEFFGVKLSFFVSAYAAVIVSFISGTHWGISLSRKAPINLNVRSNIVALLSWFSLLLPMRMSLVIIICCFLYLLKIDKLLLQAEIIEAWYMHVRIVASTLVILSLIMTLIIY